MIRCAPKNKLEDTSTKIHKYLLCNSIIHKTWLHHWTS